MFSRSLSPVPTTSDAPITEKLNGNPAAPSPKTGSMKDPQNSSDSDIPAKESAQNTPDAPGGLVQGRKIAEAVPGTGKSDFSGSIHNVKGEQSTRNSTNSDDLKEDVTDFTDATSQANASTPMSGVTKDDINPDIKGLVQSGSASAATATSSARISLAQDVSNGKGPKEITSIEDYRNRDVSTEHGTEGNVPKTEPLTSIETVEIEALSSTNPSKKRSAQTLALEQPSAKRSKSPTASEAPLVSPRYPSPPGEPANTLDKETWEGWCEIESEPAYISSMIRMMGVKDVSIREAFTTDIEEFKLLPQPVHGLIFLFRWRSDNGASPQERSCPDNVWFANQMPAQNSCATLAIMNILMNRPSIDIGEHLRQFKDATTNFSPYHRGMGFASFRFVKQIHNSFAKKMDLLEADQILANKARKSNSGDASADSADENIEENAHHFIAFLPIDGHVWKLDGLDYQPTNLGAYDTSEPEDWMGVAANRMAMLMATAGDEDYNILAVVQSPVVALREELAKSHARINAIEHRLDSLDAEWKSFLCSDSADAIPEPLSPTSIKSLGVTDNQLHEAESSAEKEDLPEDLQRLMAFRERLIMDQSGTQRQIAMAVQDEAEEDEKAKARQFDYGPVIQAWVSMLAENGFMQDHLARFTK